MNLSNLFKISDTKLYAGEALDFELINQGSIPIDIYYQLPFQSQMEKPLNYLTKIPALSKKFIYPTNTIIFKPGTILFSYIAGTKTAIYKPYFINKFDYYIIFGSIESDFVNSKAVISPDNKILSLYIENRSLIPYLVFYDGVFLGKIFPYNIDKFQTEYTLYSTNFGKSFVLGTYLEFRMDLEGAKSQFVLLEKKSTTDIYVGDVSGRSQLYN